MFLSCRPTELFLLNRSILLNPVIFLASKPPREMLCYITIYVCIYSNLVNVYYYKTTVSGIYNSIVPYQTDSINFAPFTLENRSSFTMRLLSVLLLLGKVNC